MKPNGLEVARKAVEIWNNGNGPTYNQMDCQAFVEECINQCGGSMEYAGSNDMARNAIVWMGTLDNALFEGKLVPGAGLLIHEDDESGLPDRYRGDGLGDFSHVGLYVGDELAIKDKKTKTSLFKRICNVIHSGATFGRVSGSTLQNGWTHVVWFKDVDYGEEVTPGISLGASVSDEYSAAYDEEGFETDNAPEEGTYEVIPATVYAENGKPVKIRSKPSTNSDLYWTREVGTQVEVLERGNTWCKVRSRSRVGYMMTKFLIFG